MKTVIQIIFALCFLYLLYFCIFMDYDSGSFWAGSLFCLFCFLTLGAIKNRSDERRRKRSNNYYEGI
jgi:hypothetical protein